MDLGEKNSTFPRFLFLQFLNYYSITFFFWEFLFGLHPQLSKGGCGGHFLLKTISLNKKMNKMENTHSEHKIVAPCFFFGRLLSGRLIFLRHSPFDAAAGGVVYGACHGGSRPSGSHLVEGVVPPKRQKIFLGP